MDMSKNMSSKIVADDFDYLNIWGEVFRRNYRDSIFHVPYFLHKLHICNQEQKYLAKSVEKRFE